jgi:type IV pilus assembly protein PilC
LRFDGIKLRLPVLGSILRKIVLSRFANTFALLYASGIPILESIRTTQDVVGNLVIRQGLERVEQLIGEGQNVTAAFHSTGFFPAAGDPHAARRREHRRARCGAAQRQLLLYP